MPKVKWRSYLRGEYEIQKDSLRNKMHYEIRQRAIQMMKDLLLICESEKLSRRDRIQIFKKLKIWENVAKPLFYNLMNNISVFTPDMEDFEEIQNLARGLTLYGIKYDLVELIDDKQYRERKKVWLHSRKNERLVKT